MPAAEPIPDILSSEFAADPYPVYRALRQDSPLLWHEGTGSYLVSRYEDIARVFKDRQAQFTTENYDWQLEPVHGRTIVQLSGHEHAVRRALVALAFRGEELREKFLPIIEHDSRELIDAFRSAGRADLVEEYATRFPINVIVDMLGLDKADHALFHRWYKAIIDYFGNLVGDADIAATGEHTRAEFAAYMLPIIRERRANPGEDLLSTLCAAQVDGVRMSDEDIKAFCSLLLTAGGETTDKAIAALFANLLAHPDQLDAVRRDRSLIPRAFAETLRYTPPVHMILRQTVTQVTLSGGTIPAGSTVMCLIGSANRDERRYSDPDRFDISRPDLSSTTAFSAAADHLAFALGRHFCVGALLAKAEVETGVGQLLNAMPDLRLADGFHPSEQGFATRGPRRLPVRFTPVAVA